MNKDITDLEKEHIEAEAATESFEKNPVKRVIQEMFKGPLHGREYRKLSLVDLKELAVTEVRKALTDPKAAMYLGGGNLLVGKVRKARTAEQALMDLTEYLFA